MAKSKTDFEVLAEYCKVTYCGRCKLTVEGKWCSCEFKRSPRYWDVVKIKRVLRTFAKRIRGPTSSDTER